MKVYSTNIVEYWRRHAKERYILPALFRMKDNYIIPFATEWTTNNFSSIVSQKIYTYAHYQLSYLDANDNISDYRDGGTTINLNILLEQKSQYKRWSFDGSEIENLSNGVYSIEFIDDAGYVYTTELFKVCQDVATVSTSYIIENNNNVLSDGVDIIIWE